MYFHGIILENTIVKLQYLFFHVFQSYKQAIKFDSLKVM